MREVLVMCVGNSFVSMIADEEHEARVVACLNEALKNSRESRDSLTTLSSYTFNNRYLIGYSVREYQKPMQETLRELNESQQRLTELAEKEVKRGDEWKEGDDGGDSQ